MTHNATIDAPVTFVPADVSLLLDAAAQILEGAELLHATLTRYAIPLVEEPHVVAPDAAVPDSLVPVSADVLEHYDAEQLIAFRATHRADGHDPAGCESCAILTRRLGSL